MAIELPEKITLRVQAECHGPTLTTVRARQHTLTIDEPVARGGTDRGPLPLETLLASFAACSNVIANWIARDLGIGLTDLRIEVNAVLDTRGIRGRDNLPVPFPEVRLAVRGRSAASPEQLGELQAQLRWRCPVSALLRATGTRVIEDWRIEP